MCSNIEITISKSNNIFFLLHSIGLRADYCVIYLFTNAIKCDCGWSLGLLLAGHSLVVLVWRESHSGDQLIRFGCFGCGRIDDLGEFLVDLGSVRLFHFDDCQVLNEFLARWWLIAICGAYIFYYLMHSLLLNTVLPSSAQPRFPFGRLFLFEVVFVHRFEPTGWLPLADRWIRWDFIVFVAEIVFAHEVTFDLTRLERTQKVGGNHAKYRTGFWHGGKQKLINSQLRTAELKRSYCDVLLTKRRCIIAIVLCKTDEFIIIARFVYFDFWL